MAVKLTFWLLSVPAPSITCHKRSLDTLCSVFYPLSVLFEVQSCGHYLMMILQSKDSYWGVEKLRRCTRKALRDAIEPVRAQSYCSAG